jgi:lysozyme
MNEHLTASEYIIRALKKDEAFIPFIYDDANPPRHANDFAKEWKGGKVRGYLTIGYGYASTGPFGWPYKQGARLTQAEADALLRRVVEHMANQIKSLVKVELTQNQFDALLSWQYNTGALKGSTLLKRINAGRLDEVPAQMMRWTKSTINGQKVEVPGLVKRRRREAALWRSLDEESPVFEGPAPKPVPPAPGKPMLASKTTWSAGATAMMGLLVTLQAFLETLSPILANPKTMAAGGLLVVALMLFVIYERRKKAVEDGV